MCVWFEPRGKGSIQVYFSHLITHQIQTVDDFQVPPVPRTHCHTEILMVICSLEILLNSLWFTMELVWIIIIIYDSLLYHWHPDFIIVNPVYMKNFVFIAACRFWMNLCYFLNNRHLWFNFFYTYMDANVSFVWIHRSFFLRLEYVYIL